MDKKKYNSCKYKNADYEINIFIEDGYVKSNVSGDLHKIREMSDSKYKEIKDMEQFVLNHLVYDLLYENRFFMPFSDLANIDINEYIDGLIEAHRKENKITVKKEIDRKKSRIGDLDNLRTYLYEYEKELYNLIHNESKSPHFLEMRKILENDIVKVKDMITKEENK